MNSASYRQSNNEKEFIQAALRAEQRIDGRRPFDTRRLNINFSKQDGAVEVQQGQTRVMAVVTGVLGPPYPDRPTEGSLVVFTEFSPMADPSFEPGRPGEIAVELGRVIDRGLRESRAVDTESLCVLAGRAVWAIRIDIHILDNGGNLVDVANIAALAALSSYRRPECSIGGQDGQEVVLHPPEVREPLPLIIHHYPIAVTFAFFDDGELEVVDPSFKEEAVMGGRLTVTLNSQGDICAIQKGGGVGVRSSEILRCIRIASSKASEVTLQLKKAVEANDLERTMRKIKRHPNPDSLNMSRSRMDDKLGDVEMGDAEEGSSKEDSRRKEMLELMESQEAESSSSDSEDEDDGDDVISGNVEGKKQKLDGETGVKTEAVQVASFRGSKSHIPSALFEGGPSLWDDDVKVSSKKITSRKPFDSEAVDEFDMVAGLIANAATANDTVDSKSIATMAAASVYAQMPLHEREEGRPLGPVFPQAGQTQTAPTMGILLGKELKPTPTSLLDAVKKSQKKRKKSVA